MSTEFTQTETESNGEFTASEPFDEAASKPKKSSNKVIVVVALVAVVAVVGFYGMRIVNTPSGSQPQPAPSLPPAEVAEAPPAPVMDELGQLEGPQVQDSVSVQDEDPLAGLMGEDPALVDPLAMDPSQQTMTEEYQPVDPLYQDSQVPDQQGVETTQYDEGVAISPDQIVPVQPMSQDPGLVVPVQPVQDPALQSLMGEQVYQQPVNIPAQPAVEQESDPQPVVPEVVPVHPAPAAPVQQDSSFDIASLASVVGQAVSDALQPLEERWNARFDSLERRLSRVESRPRQEAAPARASTPASRPASTPRASISRVPQASAPKRPANRIEVLDEPASAPSPRPVVRQVESFSTPTAVADESCSIGAILEGRAWVKRGDGSFESYIVGDTLPDGKTISAITPEKGIVVNGQPWVCR